MIFGGIDPHGSLLQFHIHVCMCHCEFFFREGVFREPLYQVISKRYASPSAELETSATDVFCWIAVFIKVQAFQEADGLMAVRCHVSAPRKLVKQSQMQL